MSKFKEYDVEEIDALCSLGKALSSPIRIEIMQLLYEEGMIIGDIAKKLDLPASSTAFHLKILEEAGLIRMEKQPGTRGTVKFCIRKVDYITVSLIKKNTDVSEIFNAEMPVGAFSSCQVTPTCGMFGPDGYIGNEDTEYCFYYPERMKAGILWTSSGYVEGWATYVESYGYEYAASLMNDPDSAKNAVRLAWVNRSMNLCIYSLIDIGIHYRGWDAARTAVFLRAFGINNASTAAEIYQYIVETPGNYLKYYWGYLNFLDLKTVCQKRLGDDFDLKEFHRRILDIGPVQFPVLEKYMK